MVSASIITIGDELLIGQVADTNSSWMAQELNKVGINVKRRLAVGDLWEEIWKAVDTEAEHADIILITGGLGPTSDDITKNVLCEYFNGQMIVNEEALNNVKYLFEQVFKKTPTEGNLKQAEVPDVCEVIQNKRGSAPGMWFTKNEKVFVSMPGVPYEMMGIMTDSVLPRLQKMFKLPVIIHKTLLTAGVGESFLSDILRSFEIDLPKDIKLAYLPSYGMVRLRLSTSATSKESEDVINSMFEELEQLVKEYVVTNIDEPMQAVVGKLLLKKKQTICTAESCTGGYISHVITSVPGASAYYSGSIISYSYEVKETLLNVSPNTLTSFGAVSEETVREMAKGALEKLKTDYVIAVSGIMGPEGGTPDKPVGTVWIAVGNNKEIVARRLQFRFERHKNIELTALNSLDMLRRFILSY